MTELLGAVFDVVMPNTCDRVASGTAATTDEEAATGASKDGDSRAGAVGRDGDITSSSSSYKTSGKSPDPPSGGGDGGLGVSRLIRLTSGDDAEAVEEFTFLNVFFPTYFGVQALFSYFKVTNTGTSYL